MSIRRRFKWSGNRSLTVAALNAALIGGHRAATVRERLARRRGSALLSVLWLSAALAAVGLSLAITVRGETERTSTMLDGIRAGYLASAGVDRASMELYWSATTDQKLIPKGATWVDYVFPSGNVHVEIIPETAKLNVNKADIADLMRLMVALGLNLQQAGDVVGAIMDWTHPGGVLDGYYASQIPSFRAPHASIEEIEELLSVKGVTPELFYGTYVPTQKGLERRAGLIDCLSVRGTTSQVDGNTAEAAVLQAVGVPDYVAAQIVNLRRQAPLTLGMLQQLGAGPRVRVEGNTIVTFRSTARLRSADGRLSDLRRTMAAQVKYLGYSAAELPYLTLRWYDTAWSY